MHPVPIRQELLRTIATLPDDWLEEALTLIQGLQAKHTPMDTPTIDEAPTVLERMGGMPRFLIHNGQLSDRDHRRQRLREQIQRHYKRTP